MNISEANDVNVVIRWVTGTGMPTNDESALAAMQRLATRAHKALNAGVTAEQVAQAWPRVTVG